MPRTRVIPLVAISLMVFAALGQRGGPPRRIRDPQTIHLPGGSRVEFRNFSSTALGTQAQYSIYFPPAYDKKPDRSFPVIYLLHGMFNDHTSWAVERYGNLPSVIENLLLSGEAPQFLMVHPNGENSFYTDFADGSKKYEQYIYKDLIQEIERNFRVKIGRANRAMAGTSIGGYGALKIAMKHVEVYNSVAAGSPIILLGKDPSEMMNSSSRMARLFSSLFTQVFGTPFDRNHWKENSVEVLAHTGDFKDLNIYFAYGTADRYKDAFPMERSIQTIHRILTERGISHVFQIYEGEPHGWELLRNHIKEVLQFLTQTF